jgi:excisionase family DNA binding protein
MSISAREAARLLGLSDTAVRKRIANGSLRAIKRDGVWHIPLSEIERAREAGSHPDSRPEMEALRAQRDALREERDELREEVKRLHARMEHLEAMNERLTLLLLAHEQARPLPRPLSWLARLFSRR